MSKSVQFHELAVGSSFVYEGQNYTKIETIRLSCCSSVNAAKKDNPDDKRFIVPVAQVEVND